MRVPTYDIVNAGPRNRFQANGVIVSNSGRLAQPQNYPRGSLPKGLRPEDCISALMTGDDVLVDTLWAPPLTVVSSTLRSMFLAEPGKTLIAADYANIEGRVLAWLAGETWKIEAFRAFDAGRGADLYKLAAAGIYKVPLEKVDESQRQVGKVAELACIAEGELVLTDQGLVPIERVTPHHRVWDGVEFVTHDGVVCQGTKEVLCHDGLTATPDHLVWVDRAPQPIPFEVAAARGQHLVQSGDGRRPLRVGGNYVARKTLHARLERGIRCDTLHVLRVRTVDRVCEPDAGRQQRVPSVFAATPGAAMAAEASWRDATAMYEPQRPGVAAVRGPRHRVSVSYRSDRSIVDSGALGIAPAFGVRSTRQQRALRTGQFAVRDPSAESTQPTEVEDFAIRRRMGQNSEPTGGALHLSVFGGRVSERSRHRSSVQSGVGETQELARDSTPIARARVYDILNAGPRRRFTVSGRLVHNCGYQGGVGAFQTMAANYGLSIPDEQANEIKVAWRESNPAIVAFWYDLDRAAAAAVGAPGTLVQCGPVRWVVHKNFLWCRLPSGRRLCYAAPRLKEMASFTLRDGTWFSVPAWKADRDPRVIEARAKDLVESESSRTAVAFDGLNPITRRWTEHYGYGGLWAENITQAVARDVMCEGMLRLDDAGYHIVLTVHDEVVCEEDDGWGSVGEVERILCELPAWLTGCPVSAKGWRGRRYRKG